MDTGRLCFYMRGGPLDTGRLCFYIRGGPLDTGRLCFFKGFSADSAEESLSSPHVSKQYRSMQKGKTFLVLDMKKFAEKDKKQPPPPHGQGRGNWEGGGGGEICPEKGNPPP